MNQKRQKRGGILATLFGFFWLMLLAAGIFAFIKINNIDSIGKMWQYSKYKSQEIGACLNDSIDTESLQCNLGFEVNINYVDKSKSTDSDNKNIDVVNNDKSITEALGLDTIGQEKGEPISLPDNITENLKGVYQVKDLLNYDKERALNSLNSIPVVEHLNKVNYKRTDWSHWNYVDEDHKCWSIREEVLYLQAKEDTVVLLDNDKEITKDKETACYIKTGEWVDPWIQEVITKPSQIDIDHTVPILIASKSGGKNNTEEWKTLFANDLSNLVATKASTNRKKGAKTPSEWMPIHNQCEYAKIYTKILKKYNLNITNNDKKVLKNAIGSCKF